MKLAARVEGLALVGPGLANWAEARAVLADEKAYEPRPTMIPSADALPAVERRRAGKCVRLALGTGLAAAAAANRSAKDMASIFASSSGDGENLHAICEALASDDRMISPTRFHNSVHNAPAGYWGIATGATQPSDCIAAFDASFAAGLLEAAARLNAEPSAAVLLIAYDAPYPEPLFAARPILDCFGVAMVLSAAMPPTLRIATSKQAATAMSDPTLETLRRGVPAARSLPLLQLLAREEAGEVRLEYLDGTSLIVQVTP